MQQVWCFVAVYTYHTHTATQPHQHVEFAPQLQLPARSSLQWHVLSCHNSWSRGTIPKFPLLSMQLRHPNVLAFKDSIEVQERGMHVVYLVTETVKPLATVLMEINLAGHHRQVAADDNCNKLSIMPLVLM